MEVIRRNSDYALRVLVRMAGEPVGTVFPVNALSREEGVPKEFLYKILGKLVGAGILLSFRGARGGFALTLPPGEISIRAVLEAVQGPLAVNRCPAGGGGCESKPTCSLSPKLIPLQDSLESLFESVTIRSLTEERARQEAKGQPTVHRTAHAQG